MADSDAATVKINSEKICPFISPKKTEQTTKFKLAPNNKISTDMISRITFFLFSVIPHRPTINNNTEKVVYWKYDGIFYWVIRSCGKPSHSVNPLDTTTINPTDNGRKDFHPNCINWSYLYRG